MELGIISTAGAAVQSALSKDGMSCRRHTAAATVQKPMGFHGVTDAHWTATA